MIKSCQLALAAFFFTIFITEYFGAKYSSDRYLYAVRNLSVLILNPASISSILFPEYYIYFLKTAFDWITNKTLSLQYQVTPNILSP